MVEYFSQRFTRLKIDIFSFVRKHYVPRWMVFIMDSTSVFLTFWMAYLLRFNFVSSAFHPQLALFHALLTTGIYIILSFMIRPYSGMIRHTTIIDVFYVFLTTSLTFIWLLLISIVSRSLNYPVIFQIPISILTIHYVLITFFLFGVRISIKTFYHLITSTTQKKQRVLIYGAGAMGIIVKRVLMSDIKGSFVITGFVDKNRNLQAKKINGILVYSPENINKEFLEKHSIQTLVFAIKDISSSEKSDIIKWAIDLGLEVRDTPAVDKWLNGELEMRQIERVKLEDLLGREPIALNLKKIGIGLAGKTVLVTGAAGSIGSEIVRQLTKFKIKLLVLTDQAETPIFHLENELKTAYSQCPVKIILADVSNMQKMESIFREYQPEIVFHAAAYKHVPIMEQNPHEAIRVNIGGTKVVTNLSLKYAVKKFVMISTDKAVNPTNVMGASKRLCEMIVQLKSQKSDSKTQFIITRFGNVLGSNGSVIPIFEKQIRDGGPITVTHPEIMRYFMTIPEACQLVLEAGFMGKGGEIFVFDMGKPVRIADLARQMIRLSGFVPDQDIKIEYTGLRPGEKLYEELLTDGENTKPTHHPKIKIADVKILEAPGLLLQVENMVESLYSMSKQQVVDAFRELVPEYNCINEEYNHSLINSENSEEPSEEKNVRDNAYNVLKRFVNPD
ncbi:MAG TPA: nucleoside-diphosphate sugar epimerase/dehydratase [Bacteroidales bacterium]|nr:nucleoside-diphosphate sugar epimerase/dehydratase [Bacteroidales bacterium]